MSTNFASILSKPIETAERPKPYPIGTYVCRIEKHEFGESSQKKTPYVRFFYRPLEARDDVDADALNEMGGINNEKPRLLRDDFYLTEEALYRLREFLEEKVGLTISGRSFSEVIPETTNQMLGVYVTQRAGQKQAGDDPDKAPPMFNEVNGYTRVE